MFNLSISKCPKCENGSFQLVTFDPVGAKYKLNFVQCTKCNIPVGVIDYYDSGVLLKEQEKMLKKQESDLSDVKSRVRNVENLLVQMASRINQRGSF
jgi:hypothetical protein